MGTLTPFQYAYLRDMIGDDRAANDGSYELSDNTLDNIYTDVAQGNFDMTRTIVWALRRRLGKAINDVAISSETGGSTQRNQKQEQIRRLLEYWEGVTGISGGQTRGSTVTFPYRADSLNTEAPIFPESGT